LPRFLIAASTRSFKPNRLSVAPTWVMMDILVANNNAIAPPLENYRRQGDSLTIKMTKIPK